MNMDESPEFLSNLPGLRRFNRDVIPRLVDAGFTLPRVVLEYIDGFCFDVPLPPLVDVFDEILAEELSGRGKAWTWDNRGEEGFLYRSPLLDALKTDWLKGTFSGDRRFTSESHRLLDPRFVAYAAEMFIDLPRCKAFVKKINETISSDYEILLHRVLYAYLDRGKITRKSISAIIHSIASEMPNTLTVRKEGNCDIYEIDLTANQSSIKVRAQSRLTRGRGYFDNSIALLTPDSDQLLHVLSLNQVLNPLGVKYLSQRPQLSDIGINVVFAWSVFRAIADTALIGCFQLPGTTRDGANGLK